MKRLAILSAIALSGLIYNSANAQVRLHVGLNLGPVRVAYTSAPAVVEQPVMYDQPENVYDDSNDDDYYYLPDVDAYYDIDAQCYYYNNGYNWVSAAYLPGEYKNYDWRNARRFEVREHRPYMRGDFYRSRYEGHRIEAFRHFDSNNHFAGAYRNDNHFDNRNFSRPEFNRGNDNHFNDVGRRGFNQSNNNRPQRDERGGSDNFARNNHNEGTNHRMSKF